MATPSRGLRGTEWRFSDWSGWVSVDSALTIGFAKFHLNYRAAPCGLPGVKQLVTRAARARPPCERSPLAGGIPCGTKMYQRSLFLFPMKPHTCSHLGIHQFKFYSRFPSRELLEARPADCCSLLSLSGDTMRTEQSCHSVQTYRVKDGTYYLLK